jgi:hypothetical protein
VTCLSDHASAPGLFARTLHALCGRSVFFARIMMFAVFSLCAAGNKNAALKVQGG